MSLGVAIGSSATRFPRKVHVKREKMREKGEWMDRERDRYGEREIGGDRDTAVSYTHLTLPTNAEV